MIRILSLIACVMASACTASQQADVQAAIAKNAANITAFCSSTALPLTNGLIGQAAASLVPIAGQAVADINAACAAVPLVASSASTLAWIASEIIVIKTNGAVLPPPVLPASYAADVVVAH